MMLESTDFNVEHWSRFTEEEFVEQNMKSVVFKGYADREHLFRQAYQLIIDEFIRTAKKDKGI